MATNEAIKKYAVRDKHGNIKKEGSIAVVGEVHIDVDELGGDHPTADATYQDGQLDITLHDIKGADGNSITSAHMDYEETEDGTPHADVSLDGNTLNFDFRNMKMRFSDLTLEERALLKGEQGRPGADRQPVEAGDVIIAHGTGDSETMVMDQKSVTENLTNLFEKSLVEGEVVNTDNYPNAQYISLQSGKWASTSGYSGKIIPIEPGNTYKLQSLSGKRLVYAILTTNNTTIGDDPDYVDDTSYVRTEIDADVDISIPAGAAYLYVMSNNGGTNCTPKIRKMSNVNSQVKVLAAELLKAKYSEKEVDLANYTQSKKYIGYDNLWATNNSGNVRGKFIPVTPGSFIKLQTGDTQSYYAFLKADNVTVDGRTPSFAGGEIARNTIPENETLVLEVPDGVDKAASIWILTKNSGVDIDIQLSMMTPINEAFGNILEDGQYMMPVEPVEEWSGRLNDDGTLFYYEPSSQYYGQLIARKYSVVQGKEYYVSGRTGSGMTVSSVAYYDANEEFIEFESAFAPTGIVIAYRTVKIKIPDDAAFVVVVGASHKLNSIVMPMLYEGLTKEKKEVTPYVIEYHEALIRSNLLTSDKTADPTSATQIEDIYTNSGWAVMWPSTYTHKGKPTRVIAMLHGASGYVNSSVMGYDTSGWKNWRGKYLDLGYAVVDINGVGVSDSSDENSKHRGCPMAVETLDKAYEYLRQYYNVADKMLVHGTSMGGSLAMAYAKAYPSKVLAIGLFAPGALVPALFYSTNKDSIASKWYTDAAEAIADNFQRIIGQPLVNCLALHNGVLSKMDWSQIDDSGTAIEIINQITSYEMIEYFPVPVRAWQGLSDTTVSPKLTEQLITAFQNAGSVASIRLIEGATHDASSGSSQLVVDEAVAWFKRMEG